MASRVVNRVALIGIVVLIVTVATYGQRLAMITPDADDRSVAYTDRLASHLSSQVKLLDRDLTTAAYRSVTVGNPFNMTAEEGRAISTVIGCDVFLVVRSGMLRRTPLSGAAYYESFAVLFLVDGHTGDLLLWRLKNFEAPDEKSAEAALLASVEATAAAIASKADASGRSAIAKFREHIEEVPEEGSPAAAKTKTPIPYKRIKPEYTRMAFLFDVKATIDIEVDIGADGAVLATRIVRWAGFGLEESVEAAVRAMNWRPAMRDGKPLAMRVLLRYNFTKADRE